MNENFPCGVSTHCLLDMNIDLSVDIGLIGSENLAEMETSPMTQ